MLESQNRDPAFRVVAGVGQHSQEEVVQLGDI
jgi:hypothetical protein